MNSTKTAEHTTEVNVTFRKSFNTYQPRCSCGWFSVETKGRELAQVSCNMHKASTERSIMWLTWDLTGELPTRG